MLPRPGGHPAPLRMEGGAERASGASRGGVLPLFRMAQQKGGGRRHGRGLFDVPWPGDDGFRRSDAGAGAGERGLALLERIPGGHLPQPHPFRRVRQGDEQHLDRPGPSAQRRYRQPPGRGYTGGDRVHNQFPARNHSYHLPFHSGYHLPLHPLSRFGMDTDIHYARRGAGEPSFLPEDALADYGNPRPGQPCAGPYAGEYPA